MQIQFGEIEGNQQESFLTPVSAILLGSRNLRFYVSAGLVQSLGQHRDILVGPLDIVKRRFGNVTHKSPF